MSDPKSSSASAKSKVSKPRAGVVRKSKAERDAHAKEEAEKAAARAAAAEQANGKSEKAIKPSSSRKRDVHKDNRDNSQSTGGGVFGSGSGVRPGWKKSIIDGGHSEMLEGQEAIKPSDRPKLQGQDGIADGSGKSTGAGAGPSSGRAVGVVEEGSMYENDNEPDEARRDIETICISSEEEVDEEDAVVTASRGKGKGRASHDSRRVKHGGGLRPVRAFRVLSDEEGTDGEGKDKKTAKPTGTIEDDANEVEDGDEMEVDDQQRTHASGVKHDPPSSPELSRKTKPRKSGVRPKDSKLLTETIEEKAERGRLNEDVKKLKEEFDIALKVKMDDDAGEPEDNSIRDGRLFLLQFPPLIPFLVDSAAGQYKHQIGQAEPNIKSDPDGPIPDVSAIPEEPTSETTAPKPQMEGMFTAQEPLRLPAGRVGKLNLHKSGKVTLDWGGTDMELRHGTEVDFLQDAVLVQTPAKTEKTEDEENSTPLTGTAYGLGQIKKKMIVIPDWQKLYD